jgi:hypothetical protein
VLSVWPLSRNNPHFRVQIKKLGKWLGIGKRKEELKEREK